MNLRPLLLAGCCGLLAALYIEAAQSYWRQFKWSI